MGKQLVEKLVQARDSFTIASDHQEVKPPTKKSNFPLIRGFLGNSPISLGGRYLLSRSVDSGYFAPSGALCVMIRQYQSGKRPFQCSFSPQPHNSHSGLLLYGVSMLDAAHTPHHITGLLLNEKDYWKKRLWQTSKHNGRIWKTLEDPGIFWKTLKSSETTSWRDPYPSSILSMLLMQSQKTLC